MIRAYKYRIYPSKDQEVLIQKTFGCVRYVYNELLKETISLYKEAKEHKINNYAHLKDIDHVWLKEVDAFALNNSRSNLFDAFSGFFKRLKEGKKGKLLGFPKFHSKKSDRQSYTTNNTNKLTTIRIENKKLRLPKLGLIETVFHRYCPGTIKSVTVSQNANRHYYASILTEQPDKIISVNQPRDKVLGLDMSFSDCVVPSDGTFETRTKFQRFTRQSEKKLAKAQRRLSRKQKGSKNREKARVKVAQVHDKIKCQRNDFLNKLSYQIAENYDVVVIENVNMSQLGQLWNNGKSAYDIGFGTLRSMLNYKLADRGKFLVKAPKFYPSSQLCSNCGFQNKALKNLSIREWVCPVCGAHHDRDVNAARNLVKWYKTSSTDVSSGIYAYGDTSSTTLGRKSVVCCVVEVGKVVKQDLTNSMSLLT